MSKLSQNEIDALFAQYSDAGEPPRESEAPSLPPVGVPAPPEAIASPAQVIPAPADRPAVFPTLERASANDGRPNSIDLLATVELEVTVRLGRASRSIREILSLSSGSVLELDSQAGEAVDILVNGRLLARGEVVIVSENFGVRITELVRSEEGRPA
jgi:flagellar motor switch protein FliN